MAWKTINPSKEPESRVCVRYAREYATVEFTLSNVATSLGKCLLKLFSQEEINNCLSASEAQLGDSFRAGKLEVWSILQYLESNSDSMMARLLFSRNESPQSQMHELRIDQMKAENEVWGDPRLRCPDCVVETGALAKALNADRIAFADENANPTTKPCFKVQQKGSCVSVSFRIVGLMSGEYLSLLPKKKKKSTDAQ